MGIESVFRAQNEFVMINGLEIFKKSLKIKNL